MTCSTERDKQCDLLVLGQTLTTDTGNMGHGGGSHALGRVHADVRSSIIDAAAQFAAGVIEQQLIPSILRLNYGDTDEAPTLTFQERTEDDLTARAQWIASLASAGAGGIIPLDWLGKTFGIPKPEAGEATLDEPEKTAPAHPPEDPFAAADNWNPELHPRGLDGRWISTLDNFPVGKVDNLTRDLMAPGSDLGSGVEKLHRQITDTMGRFVHVSISPRADAGGHSVNRVHPYAGVDIPGMKPGGEFSDKVLNYLKQIAPKINAHFKFANPVGQAATLKMIGEEYSTRTGLKGLWDVAQDFDASKLGGGTDSGARDPETHLPTRGIPESWRTGNELQKAATQLDFLYYDLGPANINLKSAAMLAGFTHPDQINVLAAYLTTPEGTAGYASAFVKRAQADLDPLIGGMDPDIQMQIITDYVRQGAKIFWGHVLSRRGLTPAQLQDWKAAPNIYIGPNGRVPESLAPDPTNFFQGQFPQIHSILFDNPSLKETPH